ncbi:MAG: tetratricopeptide repeat protein [Planctomycetes bacterium]|nr:tetratricopeptide repeat protein [Planctomycetota bacterium]
MNFFVTTCIAAFTALPCLWDSDTLDTELRGLPDSFDLVVGRWHRHSDAYYEDRVAKLGSRTDLALADFDDLAVAYEHLGRRDEAIATMARKADALAASPDSEHQYRYHANLGTFYAHAGRFDEALTELRTAVKINPDAHFGRERYQIEAIEYVAAAQQDPEIWRRRSFLRHAGYDLHLFLASDGLELGEYDSDEDRKRDWQGERKLDWEEAHMAVAGMLRFGGLEGAELYRSLGELYLSHQHLNLAWWAFGRAIERGHPAADVLREAQKSIESHWAEASETLHVPLIHPTAEEYAAERAKADRWLAAFQKAEAAAVAQGADVTSDAALKTLLAQADSAVPPAPQAPAQGGTLRNFSLLIASSLALLILAYMWKRS